MSLPRIYPFYPSRRRLSVVAPNPGLAAEPSLIYNPPYRRAVDDQLAWLLVRYLHPQAAIECAVTTRTPGTERRLDFVVIRGRQRVGFVVAEPDEWQDEQQECHEQSRIVASGAVEVLYSFRGPRLEERIADCLSVVAGWHPALFSPDGLTGLAGRATRISRCFSLRGTGSEVHLHYVPPALEDQYGGERFVWPEDAPEHVVVRRFGAIRRGAGRTTVLRQTVTGVTAA